MRKYIAVLLLIANALSLCSCSIGGGIMSSFSNSDRKADQRLKQILETLQNEDKDALKAMFSEQALAESDDFDGSLDYLFEFFQGNIESWKRDRFMADGLVEGGKKSVIPIAWYTVVTDEDQYMFFTIDHVEDSINPDCAGLYTLRVIKAEDEEAKFSSWQKMRMPGIYKPEN